MKKFGYAVAAIVALGVAVPTLANAETVIIKKKYGGPRAEMRHHGWHGDRGMRHHHRHADKVVIIKKRRY